MTAQPWAQSAKVESEKSGLFEHTTHIAKYKIVQTYICKRK